MTLLKKKIQFSFWVFIALAILLAIFSVQNSAPIKVSILFWNPMISLAILLIGTFLTGLITGALYAYKRFLPDNEEPLENSDSEQFNYPQYKELKDKEIEDNF